MEIQLSGAGINGDFAFVQTESAVSILSSLGKTMSDSASQPQQPQIQLQPLPAAKALYFNGFQMGIGPGDIVFTLSLNGENIVTLNASYTVAKTLGLGLAQTLKILEGATSHGIMTVEDIKKARPKIDAQALVLAKKAAQTQIKKAAKKK